MMPKNETVCCSLCGRDTANKSRICSKCYGPGRKGEEEKGRKARAVQTFAGSCIEDAEPEEWWERDAKQEYHGGSVRDDV